MSVCERCHSVIESSTSYDCSTGQYVCPDCLERPERFDSTSRQDDAAEERRSNVAQVFGTLALVCMALRFALMLAG